jgi:hypothetical protein
MVALPSSTTRRASAAARHSGISSPSKAISSYSLPRQPPGNTISSSNPRDQEKFLSFSSLTAMRFDSQRVGATIGGCRIIAPFDPNYRPLGLA